MSQNGLPGLPGGEAVRAFKPAKQTTFLDFMLADVERLPDGGSQVAFIVPGSGEVLVFPLNAAAAEKLGKQLVAPRVALPDRVGANGLHSV